MKLIKIQQQFFRIKGDNSLYFCTEAETDAELNVKAVHYFKTNTTELPFGWDNLPTETLRGDDIKRIEPQEGLGMAYRPVSERVNILNTQTPDSMGYEIHQALDKLKKAVGGDTTNFVCERLQWTHEQIKEYLFAEQVDAVALIIYNFEARNQAVIIGDQTGIGKGRIASSIIRYATVQGYIAVYCTENAGLFSDNYRDLTDIGCADLVPFIINSSTSGTTDARITVLDDNDENVVVYSPITDKKVKNKIFASGKMPKGYDYILTTYSQLKNAYKTNKKGEKEKSSDFEKYDFLASIAPKAIFIFDESHNIAGSAIVPKDWWNPDSGVKLAGSNQFTCFNTLCKNSYNSVFFSATFAKKPQNMVVYANRTCMSEAGLKDHELISAIDKGGEALQEIVSSNIVAEGQMIRRETINDGSVKVNYITLNKDGVEDFGVPDLEVEHRTKCDYITSILNRINEFEQMYVMDAVGEMNKVNDEGLNSKKTDKELGASHTPLFSKLFNIVNQLLFAIKAEAVADHAIRRLNEGKKVVIAVSSTMEAFISSLEDEDNKGEEISCDFALVLDRALENTLKIVETGEGDLREKDVISLESLPSEGQDMYFSIRESILNAVSDICISPLDLITDKIESAINPKTKKHYVVTEVTGRSRKIDFTNDDYTMGYIVPRKPVKKNIAFSQFQNNQSDVLIINTSGATGASAHATTKNTNLKPEQVKQRVMIIAQCELDVNKEVQKRGRINRTGQIKTLPPSYDYLISAIPAEQRLMMMLQKKLKSLDANSTSNQKQSKNVIDVPDFFNKYGDMLAYEYLSENPEINDKLNDPLHIKDDKDDDDTKSTKRQDFIKKVSGYVPLLTCEEQADFYDTILKRYTKLVDELKKKGEYDLEVEALDLDAKLVGDLQPLVVATAGKSCFSDAVYQGVYSCKVLQKPYSQEYIQMAIQKYTQGADAKEMAKQMAAAYRQCYEDEKQEIIDDLTKRANEKKEAAKKSIIDKGGTMQEVDSRNQQIDDETAQLIKTRCAKKDAVKNRARFIEFFYAGRACVVDGDNNTKAICLGAEIGDRTKNKFATSNITITFAVANNTKEISFSLTDRDITQLEAIRGLSFLSDGGYGYTDFDKKWLDNWHEYVKDSISDREQRVIIVGNLLRGYKSAPEHSKLISFTTNDGKVLKGLLVPKQDSTNAGMTTLVMSKYNIKDFIDPIEGAIYDGVTERFSLTRGMELCTNSENDYVYNGTKHKLMLYCTNYDTFKHLKTIPEWLAVSEDGRGFVEYKQRAQNKKVWSMKFDNDDNIKKLLSLLDEYSFKVELSPTEALKYSAYSATNTLKQGNWTPLNVNTSNIPHTKKSRKNLSPLLLAEAKLAKIKGGLKGLGATERQQELIGNYTVCIPQKDFYAKDVVHYVKDKIITGRITRPTFGIERLYKISDSWNQFYLLRAITPSKYILEAIKKFHKRGWLLRGGYIAVDAATWENFKQETKTFMPQVLQHEAKLATTQKSDKLSGVDDYYQFRNLQSPNTTLPPYSERGLHEYGSLKREDFIEWDSDFHREWKGVFGGRGSYSVKEVLTPLLKYFYPEITFSIKRHGYHSITVTVISSPCEKGSDKLKALCDEILMITNGFNYDRSEPMTDYYDRGFYENVQVSDKYRQNNLVPRREFTVQEMKDIVIKIDNKEPLPKLANPKKEAKTTKPSTTSTAPTDFDGSLQIVDYSDKAIVLTGDTKPLKDEIKALGGKFGSRFDTTKVPSGIGWLFPKTKLQAVKEFVSKYSGVAKTAVSQLLLNEAKLAYLAHKNFHLENDWRESMRYAFNHLVKELGEKEGRETFEWYCKTYNVGISDPMPPSVKLEIFGTSELFTDIAKQNKTK